MAGSNTSQRLRQAIVLNDLPLVQRLLKANPAYLHNPNFEDKSNTSLHLAAQHGLIQIADYLISQGHDSTKPVEDDIYSNAGNNQGTSINTDGHTPLHLASANLHTPLVQLLCENFPKTVNRADDEGCTPLLLASRAQSKVLTQTYGSYQSKPTIRAAEDTSTIGVLLSYGADIRATDKKGNTPLHHACGWGNLKAVRALMQAGVDPLQANNAGWKPELYSLTVQAEVYFRNLVAEFEKRRAEEKERFAEQKRAKGAGAVRLVSDDDEGDEDDESESSQSYAGRSRAGSGRSTTTTES